MIERKEVFLDFTKSREIKEKVRWSDPDKITASSRGLGWDGPDNACRDFWIETTEPMAVGWSWRPVTGVTINAEVLPSGKFEKDKTSVRYPPGQLYVRYSPDTRHWSTWQVLEMQPPNFEKQPRQLYHVELRVPNKEQEAYKTLVREYLKLDVPWTSDEEAAVRWILKKDPLFFAKNLPFIGYLQFRYEICFPGSGRITGLKFEINFGAGGIHSMPRNGKYLKDRMHMPWRFKAPPDATPKYPATCPKTVTSHNRSSS